jgi:hypothetical protein
MRGQRERSGSLFSYVSIEERIPASHPLRRDRKLADQDLDRLNPTFCELYASEGRPSVPAEQLLLASLLQAFCGIRSVPGVNYVGGRQPKTTRAGGPPTDEPDNPDTPDRAAAPSLDCLIYKRGRDLINCLMVGSPPCPGSPG